MAQMLRSNRKTCDFYTEVRECVCDNRRNWLPAPPTTEMFSASWRCNLLWNMVNESTTKIAQTFSRLNTSAFHVLNIGLYEYVMALRQTMIPVDQLLGG